MKPIAVRVPDEIHSGLSALAKLRGRDLADELREALRGHLYRSAADLQHETRPGLPAEPRKRAESEPVDAAP